MPRSTRARESLMENIRRAEEQCDRWLARMFRACTYLKKHREALANHEAKLANYDQLKKLEALQRREVSAEITIDQGERFDPVDTL